MIAVSPQVFSAGWQKAERGGSKSRKMAPDVAGAGSGYRPGWEKNRRSIPNSKMPRARMFVSLLRLPAGCDTGRFLPAESGEIAAPRETTCNILLKMLE